MIGKLLLLAAAASHQLFLSQLQLHLPLPTLPTQPNFFDLYHHRPHSFAHRRCLSSPHILLYVSPTTIIRPAANPLEPDSSNIPQVSDCARAHFSISHNIHPPQQHNHHHHHQIQSSAAIPARAAACPALVPIFCPPPPKKFPHHARDHTKQNTARYRLSDF